MLDKLLFALSDFVWAYNHSANAFVFIGPNVQRVLGLGAEAFSADALADLIITEDRESFFTVNGDMKPDKWTEFYYRIKVNGNLKWIIEKRIRFVDEQAGDEITLGVIKDVTDQNTVKHYLNNALGNFSMLFDENHSPMWIYETPSLRIIKVNHAATEHYGYSTKEFLSMTIRDVRPKFDLAAFNEYIFKKGITKGKKVGYNSGGIWVHQNKNGEIIYAEITGHEIKYNNTSCRIIIATDVTDRVIYEQERDRMENAG